MGCYYMASPLHDPGHDTLPIWAVMCLTVMCMMDGYVRKARHRGQLVNRSRDRLRMNQLTGQLGCRHRWNPLVQQATLADPNRAKEKCLSACQGHLASPQC